MQRPPFRVLVAVGLISGSALAFQVLLTRLLSAVLFYDFVFLAISLALLGTGVGGIVVYVKPQLFERESLERSLLRWCTIVAVLFVVVPLGLVRLDYTYNNVITASFVIAIVLACVLSLLPFLAIGVAIALAIRGYQQSVGRVYAYDLVGAGLGAALVVPVMWIVSAPTGIVVLGAVAALAAVLLALPTARLRLVPLAVLALTILATAVSGSTGLNYLPSPYFPTAKPSADIWTPLDRVLGFPPPHGDKFGYLFYDRVYAPVPVHRRGTPFPTWKQLETSSQSVGLTVAHHGDALVIGGGGGRDIYDALSSGFHHVDVIELNTAIVNVVDNALGGFSGKPYVAPGVKTAVGDGRAILAASSKKYDEIHIGFTDTLSGSSADAFALSEQNLYTTEAFEEYYDHLKPGGILNVTRLNHLVGDEALRITTLTLQALQDRGVAAPQRNVIVILGHDQFGSTPGTVLSQLTPFTAAQLSSIRTLAQQRGDEIAFAPGGPYVREWVPLHDAKSLTQFCTHYQFNVCASTDNDPFFFNMTRISGLFQSLPKGYVYTLQPFTLLGVTVGVLLVLAFLGFSIPFAFVDRRKRPSSSSLSYFAAIGIGFLTFEISLIQRFVLFLGFPTYALSVVLSSLLIFTGIGSWLSGRWQIARRGLALDLAVATVLMVVSAFALQSLLGHLIGLPFTARVVLTVALLAPFGITLGMAMPVGLGRLSALSEGSIPWAWGVNGFASVFGASIGIFIAIEWGFIISTIVAAVFYLGAFLHATLGRWPTPSDASAVASGAPAGATDGIAPGEHAVVASPR